MSPTRVRVDRDALNIDVTPKVSAAQAVRVASRHALRAATAAFLTNWRVHDAGPSGNCCSRQPLRPPQNVLSMCGIELLKNTFKNIAGEQH